MTKIQNCSQESPRESHGAIIAIVLWVYEHGKVKKQTSRGQNLPSGGRILKH